MAAYRLTRRAATDLDGIFEFTAETFGVEQARSYLDGIHGCCERLSGNPLLGRSADSLAAGLRRYEFRSHVVFYLPDPEGVVVVRVLHVRMDPSRHV